MSGVQCVIQYQLEIYASNKKLYFVLSCCLFWTNPRSWALSMQKISIANSTTVLYCLLPDPSSVLQSFKRRLPFVKSTLDPFFQCDCSNRHWYFAFSCQAPMPWVRKCRIDVKVPNASKTFVNSPRPSQGDPLPLVRRDPELFSCMRMRNAAWKTATIAPRVPYSSLRNLGTSTSESSAPDSDLKTGNTRKSDEFKHKITMLFLAFPKQWIDLI